MSKKPITWLELIKMKLSEEKAKGKAPSIGDVTPLAKKEWVQIKEGKHPKYIQGKAQTFARKKKGEAKTRKNAKEGKGKSATPSSASELRDLLDELKLCVKCTKKADKYMKKKGMKGGNCGISLPQAGGQCGTCGGAPLQNGGCGTCGAL